MTVDTMNDSLIEMKRLKENEEEAEEEEESEDEDEPSRNEESTVDSEDLESLIPKEISAKQVLMFLAGDIQRTRNYKTMPFYFVFLVVFTSMIVFVNLAHLTLNPDYYFNQSSKDAMDATKMEAIKEREEIWDWLDGVSKNLWHRTPKGTTGQCSTAFTLHTEKTIDPSSSARSLATIPIGVTQDDCCSRCYSTKDCVAWTYDNSTASCILYEGISVVANTDPDIVCGLSANNGWYSFFPITLFVVRQWRVNPQECDLSERKFLILPSSDRYNIDGLGGCVLHYEEDDVTTKPFGVNGMFISEKELQRNGGPPPLDSEMVASTATDRNYDMGDAYAQLFSYTATYQDVAAKLKRLRKDHWIDGQTRAVSVDAIFFDPELNTFVHFNGKMEFFVTGSLINSRRSTPFSIWSFETPLGAMLFAMDWVTCLCVIGFTIDTIMSKMELKKIEWITGAGILGVWEIFEAANVITFFITYYARGQMWREGFELFQHDNVEKGVRGLGNCTEYCEERVQFSALTKYSGQSYLSASWFAPSIILAYLRLFKFLQHNVRLNALSETVKEAIGDLVGMGLIFCIVIIGYAIAGTLLFAHEFDEFQTFFATTSYLVRVIFTGEMSLWNDMVKVAHPVIVASFMLSWFVICWLVLLNMILAVIAGAFSVVQENMQAKQSSNRSIATDIKNYVFKYLLCCPQIRETGNPDEKKPSRLYGCCRNTKGAHEKQITFSKGWGSRYIQRRVNSMMAIKEYYEMKWKGKKVKKGKKGSKMEWDKIFLTEDVLQKIMRWAKNNGEEVLNEYEMASVFQDAMSQTLGDQMALRIGERSIERMMGKMEEFHRKLEVSNSVVNKLHMIVEDQGIAINSITAQSTMTAKSVDKMGARVKQAVVTVTESATAVGAVADTQHELVTTTQDIAAAVETEHQNRSSQHSHYPSHSQRARRRRTSLSPSMSSTTANLILLSPSDPGVKDAKQLMRRPSAESSQNLSTPSVPDQGGEEPPASGGAYSWD